MAEVTRSLLLSLSFFTNIRTAARARAMVLTMVYSKVTTLRNLGDKSIGEASTTRQDLLLPITIILHKASKIISGTFPAL